MASAEQSRSRNEYWDAFVHRDANSEGQFIYAVVTTGIYCRPSCPSRRPHPKNVRFFASRQEARRAGYRPCKRCKPDEATPEPMAAVIAKAAAVIEATEGAPNYNAIAEAAGMSRHHFHRSFKRVVGMTPGAYRRALRERRAVHELSKAATVTEAIYDAGYGSSSRFYEKLAPNLGIKPSAFSKGGRGELIRFGTSECSLGVILVAATDKGVCAIELGDRPGELIENFAARFPKAELMAAGADFEQILARAISLVEDPGRGFDLPLHVRGTAFQLRVWEALRTLKPGDTASYKDLAVKAGVPGAARAVARACASNKIAVAIPCHRVVRADGSLSGYRWGAPRKAGLLARERPHD